MSEDYDTSYDCNHCGYEFETKEAVQEHGDMGEFLYIKKGAICIVKEQGGFSGASDFAEVIREEKLVNCKNQEIRVKSLVTGHTYIATLQRFVKIDKKAKKKEIETHRKRESDKAAEYARGKERRDKRIKILKDINPVG